MFTTRIYKKDTVYMYKTVMIDTNSANEANGGIYLSEDDVKYFSLEDGMKIEAYMDNEVWHATVHKLNLPDIAEQWYVELGECIEQLDEKCYKWEQIGWNNGFCAGTRSMQTGVILRMLNMGYDIETIEKAVGNISEERLKKIKRYCEEKQNEISDSESGKSERFS